MTYLTLSITLIFVVIPLVLSKTLRLGLEKDTIIATVRSIIQLLAVGYVLKFVFDSENLFYIFLMVALMVVAATLNTRKKGKSIKGITWKVAVTLILRRNFDAKYLTRLSNHSRFRAIHHFN